MSLSEPKNGGICFDDDGTDKFSCDCKDPFTGENCEIIVKVIIDFELEIQERWTPGLNDSTSDEFKYLANIYVAPFNERFLQDEIIQVGDLGISFGKVRVLRFILENSSLFDDSSFRYVIFHQFDWSSGVDCTVQSPLTQI